MSKIAREEYNKKHNMPDYKVMGTISPTVSKKLTKLITSGDKQHIVEIIDHINTILGVRIKGISADIFPEPFEGKPTMSTSYDTTEVVMYVITSGNAQLTVGSKTFDAHPNKIYMINDRNIYRILKNNKSKLCMLSAVFEWDKGIHGG